MTYWPHSDPEPQRTICCVGPHKPPSDDDGTWQPPTTRSGLLCSKCRQRLATLLIELPAVAAWLNVNKAPSIGVSLDGHVSGSREAPMPLRRDVLDLVGPTNGQQSVSQPAPPARYQLWAGAQHVTSYRTRADADRARWELRHDDDPTNQRDLGYYRITLLRMTRDQIGDAGIYDRIMGWAEQVHDEAFADLPPRKDLATLARWLHGHFEWICRQEWVNDMLDDLIDAESRSRQLAPWEPEHKRLRDDCPSCDMRALVFVRGKHVECVKRLGGCGRKWDDQIVARPANREPVTAFDRLVLVLGHKALDLAE